MFLRNLPKGERRKFRPSSPSPRLGARGGDWTEVQKQTKMRQHLNLN